MGVMQCGLPAQMLPLRPIPSQHVPMITDDTKAWLRRVTLVVIGALLVLMVGWVGLQPIHDSPDDVFPNPHDRVRFQLRTVGALIERFQEASGNVPAHADELIADSALGIDEDAFTDPWGGKIRYGVRDGSYWLLSAGEDGEFDTMDDINYESPRSTGMEGRRRSSR